MLVSPAAATWGAERLTPEDFWREAHVEIFRAMQHLVTHKVAVDFLTVFDYFRVRGEAEEIGGATFITELADGVPRGTNIEYYAGILQNDRVRRDLLGVSDRIVAEVVRGALRGPALIDKADGWLLALPRPDAADELVLVRDRPGAILADFAARVAREGALSGLDTGLDVLNHELSGLQPNDLTIVAARPSVGKTALAGHLALTAARLWKYEEIRKTVGFFSLEMSREQVEYRLIAALSGVPIHKILHARDLAQWETTAVENAIAELGTLPIAIDPTGRITVEQIRSKARRLMATEGLGLLIVDYIQLVTGSAVNKRDSGNRNVELTHASRQLKLLAKELGIPVVELSQLSRAPEGRDDNRPKMSDLRESGALEQDADNVLLMHRPPPGGDQGCITEIIIEKQRNGPTSIQRVFFEKELMRFREAVPSDFPDLPAPAIVERRVQRPKETPRPLSFLPD